MLVTLVCSPTAIAINIAIAIAVEAINIAVVDQPLNITDITDLSYSYSPGWPTLPRLLTLQTLAIAVEL